MYDLSLSEPYDVFAGIVSKEFPELPSTRSLSYKDSGNLVKVYYHDEQVGVIEPKNSHQYMVSFNGIGGADYPIGKDVYNDDIRDCGLAKLYEDFDKSVVEGKYLLDNSNMNDLRCLYYRVATGESRK